VAFILVFTVFTHLRIGLGLQRITLSYEGKKPIPATIISWTDGFAPVFGPTKILADG
jgi:hypothetical protein